MLSPRSVRVCVVIKLRWMRWAEYVARNGMIILIQLIWLSSYIHLAAGFLYKIKSTTYVQIKSVYYQRLSHWAAYWILNGRLSLNVEGQFRFSAIFSYMTNTFHFVWRLHEPSYPCLPLAGRFDSWPFWSIIKPILYDIINGLLSVFHKPFHIPCSNLVW